MLKNLNTAKTLNLIARPSTTAIGPQSFLARLRHPGSGWIGS